MPFKIEHDRSGCIGCGACAALCPDNWTMAADGKSKPKKLELKDLGCNKDAADACPVNVIHIIDLKTKKKLI